MAEARHRNEPVARLAAVLLLAASVPVLSQATTHIIAFGGAVGLAYSPSTLAVAVGDTIEWQGNFATHPLRSTEIPAGAPSWSNGSGTVFRYVVPLAGAYDYTCDIHGPSMSGSFVAALSSVEDGTASVRPGSFDLLQNYPNPFNPETIIEYSVPGPGSARVTLTVYNLLGQEIAVLVDAERSAGMHTVTFDAGGVPSGVYLYKLTAGGNARTRSMILMR